MRSLERNQDSDWSGVNDRRRAVTICAGLDRTGGNLGSRGTCEVKAAARRQEYAETGRASSGRPQAAERNAPVVFLDDASADPETEARPLGRFRAEERLEQFSRVLRFNSNAGVHDGHGNPSPFQCPVVDLANSKSQGSSVWHRLNRVADQIEEDLAQLDGEAMYHPWREVALSKLDVAIKKLPLLQPQHVIQQFGESNCNRSLGLAIKAQGLASDVRDALQFLLSERRAMPGVLIE